MPQKPDDDNPLKKERVTPLPSFLLTALAEAVAAGAVLAVTGVAHMNGSELAVHAVAVVLAVRHPAGDAAVDTVLHPSTSFYAVSICKFREIIGNSIDKRENPM